MTAASNNRTAGAARLGQPVDGIDGPLGRVVGLVDGSGRRRLSSLIVERGRVRRTRRVVPAARVAGACDGRITLDLDAAAFGRLPEYETRYAPTPYRRPLLLRRGRTIVEWPDTTEYRIVTARGVPDESIVLTRGMAVIDADGRRVGRVDAVAADAGRRPVHILITSRGASIGRRRVPVELIDGADTDGLHLTVPAAGLLDLDLDEPPIV